MNLRRIIGTLIVLLATIVGRWIAREPATTRASKRRSKAAPVPEAQAMPAAGSLGATPSYAVAPATTRLVPESGPVAVTNAPVYALDPPVAVTHAPLPAAVAPTPVVEPAVILAEPVHLAAPPFDAPDTRPLASDPHEHAALPEPPVAVAEPPLAAAESPAAPAALAIPEDASLVLSVESPSVFEAPVSATRSPVSVMTAPVSIMEAPADWPTAARAETSASSSAAATAFTRPRAWSRDWPIAVPAQPESIARDEAIALSGAAVEPNVPAPEPEPEPLPRMPLRDAAESEVPAPERPTGSVTSRTNGSVDHTTERPRANEVSVEVVRDPDADEPDGTRPTPPPLSPRTRRRSESIDRPNRLLGGAGFLIVAIACFVGSFVLFVRLTTPDRSPASVYTVVSYVAATEHNVPPALASFAGDTDAGGELWLVMRLPVAARYVALTGLRTIDHWTSYDTFSLVGLKATLEPNAGSCYSGVGVTNGPPELTPLPSGLVVREQATSTLSPEHLVRVDVGALLADATGTKTLVCAVVSPARTGFSTYAATIGAPDVMASEVTGSPVKLSVLPLAVDFSTFGNTSALRFTQSSLAVATDPMHATLDVAGFATFAYSDADGDARRDVLLFITGALATLGAVATVDALRPWLGIERR